jgi:hypothetical protein
MDRLDASLLSKILFRCKHPKSTRARRLDVDNGRDSVPLSSFRLVSKQWATEGLQLLGTIKVLHNFKDLDQSSLQRLLECAHQMKILDIAFPIPEPSESRENMLCSCKSSFAPPLWERVKSPCTERSPKAFGRSRMVE